MREDEILRSKLTLRVLRKVTHSLTVQYDRVMYLLEDTPGNRSLIHTCLDVFEFPDGQIEIQSNGAALPYVPYDRLADIDQGAVVENKRLGHALQVAQAMQEKRDSRRASGSPSHTNQGQPVRSKTALPGLKTQRAMTREDFNHAIEEVAETRKTVEQIVVKPIKKALVEGKIRP